MPIRACQCKGKRVTFAGTITDCLSDLVDNINQVDHTFRGKPKLIEWLATLNNMKAHEELDADQVRQFLFDTETTYNEFHKALTA